jgi:hypothetical protein
MNPLDKTIKIHVGKEQKKSEENWYKQVEKVGVALTKRYIIEQFNENPQWLVTNNLGQSFRKMEIQNSWDVEDDFLHCFADAAYEVGVYPKSIEDKLIDSKMYIYQALVQLNKEKKFSFVEDNLLSPTYIVEYRDYWYYIDEKRIQFMKQYVKDNRAEFEARIKQRMERYE